LYSATGINDAGQIAVDAIQRSTGEIHAVLLTPNGSSTPTPTPTPAPTPTPTPTPTPCGTPTNFAHTTPISIPASGTIGIAAPYPSSVAVGALSGNVVKVTVKLNNFNHTFPDDVDILLVGPGGQNAIIMSDVGGATDAVNVTLTLDDAALSILPDIGPLISGTFRPTNFGNGDTFPGPAPAPSGGSALSVFNGTNPNGTWSLYVVDDQSTDLGNLAGGWELSISTDNCGTPTKFDFEGDGKADISVFRPSDRVWYLNRSTAGFSATQFGLSSDRITPADFDGDGKTDIAVFRDGVWYWLASSNGTVGIVQFGIASDIPVPADYTGDGRAELAVYRGGVWWTLNLANNQSNAVQFGIDSDKPVPADFDGDGKTDFAVYRDGIWYMLRSTTGFAAVQFGIASDTPTVGDYDGDGKADQAVYRDGVWYVLGSTQGFYAVQFGIASDLPVAADYDGDGKTDVAVFRGGVWYMLRSQQGFSAVQFGIANDKPIPAAFVP
ncbi:MAG: VCBS repeat-containing protein, partial [Acidobacteriota bacterium]